MWEEEVVWGECVGRTITEHKSASWLTALNQRTQVITRTLYPPLAGNGVQGERKVKGLAEIYLSKVNSEHFLMFFNSWSTTVLPQSTTVLPLSTTVYDSYV